MRIIDITPRNAANVLAHLGYEGGYVGHNFTVTLLRSIEQADSANLARIALGFPGLVAAMQLARSSRGIEDLQRFARRSDGHGEAFGVGPAQVEVRERGEFAVRWTGFEGAINGAPLAVQISTALRERHARQHAEEIRDWQTTVGITPDAEPVGRTTLLASTPWESLPDREGDASK